MTLISLFCIRFLVFLLCQFLISCPAIFQFFIFDFMMSMLSLSEVTLSIFFLRNFFLAFPLLALN